MNPFFPFNLASFRSVESFVSDNDIVGNEYSGKECALLLGYHYRQNFL
jgi:hypothetical protein